MSTTRLLFNAVPFPTGNPSAARDRKVSGSLFQSSKEDVLVLSGKRGASLNPSLPPSSSSSLLPLLPGHAPSVPTASSLSSASSSSSSAIMASRSSFSSSATSASASETSESAALSGQSPSPVSLDASD